MLYTTSESTHTNTSSAKGKYYKSRINNKLAIHSGVLCVTIPGRGLFKIIVKFYKIKVSFNLKSMYALN